MGIEAVCWSENRVWGVKIRALWCWRWEFLWDVTLSVCSVCENVKLEFSCAGVEVWKNDGFYVLLAFLFFCPFVTAEEKMMGRVC